MPAWCVGRRGRTESPPCHFLWNLTTEKISSANPRTFYELQYQIRSTFDAVPVDFVRKSVKSLSCELQKGVQDAGAKSDIKWECVSFNIYKNLATPHFFHGTHQTLCFQSAEF
jgi:hypothetical protein